MCVCVKKETGIGLSRAWNMSIMERVITDRSIEVENTMFGFGKKAKKLNGTDVLIVKTTDAKARNFYQVSFPTMVANDVVSMLKKLEKSKLNRKEYLGDIGGFHLATHYEGLSSFEVLDEADLESQLVPIQDFSSILLRRLQAVEQSGELEDSEDLAFIMGELTMLRDGSFVQPD